jgi:hypothetical protein
MITTDRSTNHLAINTLAGGYEKIKTAVIVELGRQGRSYSTDVF